MDAYAVYLDEPNEAAWETIRSTWPDRHFILDDRLAFVAPEGLTLSSDISKKVEGEPGNLSVVVVGIASYFGFHRPELWEWLSKVR